MKDVSCPTSPTLLGRLRHAPNDAAAWDEFVRRYGPRIYGWCRQRGLQDADAKDVSQNLLLDLLRKMRTFDYDPSRSFRAWLKTLTIHAVDDLVTRREHLNRASGDDQVMRALGCAEARKDLAEQVQEEFDLELLEEAQARVRRRVEPPTWEAFRLTALEGMSGAEAGSALGMPAARALQYKARVQRMLRDEVARLQDPEGEPS